MTAKEFFLEHLSGEPLTQDSVIWALDEFSKNFYTKEDLARAFFFEDRARGNNTDTPDRKKAFDDMIASVEGDKKVLINPVMRFDKYGDKKVSALYFDTHGKIEMVEVRFLDRFDRSCFYRTLSDGSDLEEDFFASQGNLVGKLIY